jgi:UDP-2,3-diacylglucosamine pyrophosphatase LpxH
MLVRLDHQAKKIDALRKTLTDDVAKSDSLSLLGDELQTLASDQAICKVLFQQARELEKDSKSKSSTDPTRAEPESS